MNPPVYICRICKNHTNQLLYATVRTEYTSGVCSDCYSKMTPMQKSIISNLCGVDKGLDALLKVLTDLQTIMTEEVSCLVSNGIRALQSHLIVSKAFLKDRILDNI